MNALYREEAVQVTQRLSRHLDDRGFECHPFLVGWYNDRVGPKFALQYDNSHLAIVVLSRPNMFEKTFLPFLTSTGFEEGKRDPLDECIRQTMMVAKEKVFPEEDVEIMHDFELHPNRRPKILVQTAAHVSGAVKLFQKCDILDETLLDGMKKKKVFPVCIHPRFGGWFAIRTVFVFRRLRIHDWDNLPTCSLSLREEEISRLLILFNDHWQDNEYRDYGVMPKETYSKMQRDYFATVPTKRWQLIRDRLLNEAEEESS